MNALHASLRPEERFIGIKGQIGSTRNRIVVGLRRRIGVKANTLPIHPLHNLDQLHIGTVSETIQRTENFFLFELSVLVHSYLAGHASKVASLIHLKTPRED